MRSCRSCCRSLPQTRAHAQDRGAAALGSALQGLGVNTRVLIIGAHPDDEDTQVIAWLSRGRHVETAYLSLTRGDGGQNVIGNELGEALGVIRTEELLAARRIDGGRQFFTRAYDYGFSKNAEEAFTQWPHDSLLLDVMTVVRAFKPHVIISVFTGTPRDGHGQHQAAGILAREAYDLSADTVRFPRAATAGHGAWTVSKFYRGATNAGATGGRDAHAERRRIRPGARPLVRRDRGDQPVAAPVAGVRDAAAVRRPVRRRAARGDARSRHRRTRRPERSLFDGIDTTWARFRDDGERRRMPAPRSIRCRRRSLRRRASFRSRMRRSARFPHWRGCRQLLNQVCAPAFQRLRRACRTRPRQLAPAIT